MAEECFYCSRRLDYQGTRTTFNVKDYGRCIACQYCRDRVIQELIPDREYHYFVYRVYTDQGVIKCFEDDLKRTEREVFNSLAEVSHFVAGRKSIMSSMFIPKIYMPQALKDAFTQRNNCGSSTIENINQTEEIALKIGGPVVIGFRGFKVNIKGPFGATESTYEALTFYPKKQGDTVAAFESFAKFHDLEGTPFLVTHYSGGPCNVSPSDLEMFCDPYRCSSTIAIPDLDRLEKYWTIPIFKIPSGADWKPTDQFFEKIKNGLLQKQASISAEIDRINEIQSRLAQSNENPRP